jgi:transposase-like protein
MSKPAMNVYPAEFKERAVKLAVESEQPIAQTARDLGLNENTLHTWIGQYHRVERQTQHSPRHSIFYTGEEGSRPYLGNIRLTSTHSCTAPRKEPSTRASQRM